MTNMHDHNGAFILKGTLATPAGHFVPTAPLRQARWGFDWRPAPTANWCKRCWHSQPDRADRE